MASILPDTTPNTGLLGGASDPGGQFGASAPIWSLLMGLGGGIAAGSGKGWGAGIGLGTEQALKLLQQRMQMQQQAKLQNQRLTADRYQVSQGPNGQPIIIDRWAPQNSGMQPLGQMFTPQQGSLPQGQPSGVPGNTIMSQPPPLPGQPEQPPADQNAPVASTGYGNFFANNKQSQGIDQYGNPLPGSGLPSDGLGPQAPIDLASAAGAKTAPNPMGYTSSGVGQIASSGSEALKLAQAGRENAVKANAHLDALTSALDKLPPSGPLSAGPYEEGTADFAGKANDIARRTGLPLPFDQEHIANLELAGKESKLAGLSQGRASFGASREGQQTIQLLQHTVPSQTMSPLGRRMIVAQNRALNQRDIDYADFLSKWMQNPSHPADPTGAAQAFDQIRPPQFYADMANKEVSQYGTSGGSPQQTAMTKAKEAIAAGAPKNAVIKRLVAAGINPSGL